MTIKQTFKEFSESSAGLSYNRLPLIGALDRTKVEKIPWRDSLHREFFDNETQKVLPHIQRRLTKLAYDFIKSMGIPRNYVKDILFKGSLAGYNYTPTSDVDLQVVLRYNWDKNPMRSEGDRDGKLLEREFNSKRAAYNKENHFTIGSEGFPVEFFIHTPKSNTKTGASARWSVLNNGWVPGYKPNKSQKLPKKDEVNVAFKNYYNRVRNAYISGTLKSIRNRQKNAKLGGLVIADKVMKGLARNERNIALHAPGASLQADVTSPENLAFKALKRTKLIAYLEAELKKELAKSKGNVSESLDDVYADLDHFIQYFNFESEELRLNRIPFREFIDESC